MKHIVFDAGPVISLSTNNLLWILEVLSKECSCKFAIPEGVKQELIDVPLNSKRFKFSAIQVLRQLEKGTFKVVSVGLLKKKTQELMDIANKCFIGRNNYIKILHEGEVESLVAYLKLNASLLIIDERTTRVLIEDPFSLKSYLERKLHTRVETNKKNIKKLQSLLKDIKIVRSAELITYAYERGLLDDYLPNLIGSRELLLDSLLWGLKLNGCAISSDEIERIKAIEKQKV